LAYVKPGDGELASSPFHVRFGKIICTLLPQEKKGMLNDRFWVNAGMHYGPKKINTSSEL
jgi:phosphatidate phosphatase PAH1